MCIALTAVFKILLKLYIFKKLFHNLHNVIKHIDSFSRNFNRNNSNVYPNKVNGDKFHNSNIKTVSYLSLFCIFIDYVNRGRVDSINS